MELGYRPFKIFYVPCSQTNLFLDPTCNMDHWSGPVRTTVFDIYPKDRCLHNLIVLSRQKKVLLDRSCIFCSFRVMDHYYNKQTKKTACWTILDRKMALILISLAKFILQRYFNGFEFPTRNKLFFLFNLR